MVRIAVIFSLALILSACGGGGGGGSSSPDPSDAAITLTDNGNDLPAECQFSNNQLRGFSPSCDLVFTISTRGDVNADNVVGQYSIDGGIIWRDLATTSSMFELPVSQVNGDIAIRGLYDEDDQTLTSATANYQIESNTVELGEHLGSFAETAIFPIAENANQFALVLPDCTDPQGDGVEVEVLRDEQVWFVQSPLAVVELATSSVEEGASLKARCRDVLESEHEVSESTTDAPGTLVINKGAESGGNLEPFILFQPITAERFAGQIRDFQTFEACYVAVDPLGGTLISRLSYQFDDEPEIELPTTNNCADVPISNQGDQRLSLIVRAANALSTSTLVEDLGIVHQDTIATPLSSNSRCIPGDLPQSVSVTIEADPEFDPYFVQVFDAQTDLLLRDLGQVTQATISFACDELGQTQYYLRNTSRGVEHDSALYTHSVTTQPNQDPVIDITIPDGDLVGLEYRDNQDLTVCADVTDPDGDSTSVTLAYQFDDEALQTVSLSNSCGIVNTDGRGGQELIFIATATDGFTTVTDTRNVGEINADTIQFPSAESGNCVLGSLASSYSVSVASDSEGDSHSLTVVDVSTGEDIQVLGSVTLGQFSLPCDTLGNRFFRIDNESRDLTVSSLTYLHTVTEQVNLPPSLSVDISGDVHNNQYRDQQTLDICFTSLDPEGSPVAIDANYVFSGDSVETLTLDGSNCGQVSTLNRGNQTLTLLASSSDGIISTSLTESLSTIHLDTIQIATSASNSCLESPSSLTYTVDITGDFENDTIDLNVYNGNDNSLIAALGDTEPFAFSLSCATLGTTPFYIINRSRSLGTISQTYQHEVSTTPNTPPEVSIYLDNVEEFDGDVRDNQIISICVNEFDADGDNLTTTVNYQFDSDPLTELILNTGCADITTNGQGGRTLSVEAMTSDSVETVTANSEFPIYRDTIQFPFTSSQSCRIGDPNRVYSVTVASDIENDGHNIQVIDADSQALLFDLGSATMANFSLSCAAATTVNFYLKNTSRGIATQSITYQHLVSNIVNAQPAINLQINNADYISTALRDDQIIQVCGTVSDADVGDTLVTKIFYQFDNEPLQEMTLSGQCGNLDLTGQGDKQLVLQGFVSDGTATTNDTLSLNIHQDTINVAYSSSGSCSVGDPDLSYVTLVAADAQGDVYSVDVIDMNTNGVLASLGQVTAGNFSLPCDTQGATNFAIRTTSRNKTVFSLVYSHVVSDLLNSAPTPSINIISGEQHLSQYRDNQNISVCIDGTDPDNDPLTFSAAYRFDNNGFVNLPLSTGGCGVISTTGQGGNNLVIQGFANDGQIETTTFSDLGEIHTDTIQVAQSVSSECTLGEPALRYSVFVPADTEGDEHNITVIDQDSGALIADLGTASESEFTLNCSDLGETNFLLINDSRGIQSISASYNHKVNASITNTVAVYLTTGDQASLLAKQTDEELKVGTGNAAFQVDVSDVNVYEAIESFGATFTDSAAALIHGSANKDAIITQLFNQDTGIGISGLRYPMAGMSEFVSRVAMSYDDRPPSLTDPNLDFFSINADHDFMIPLLEDVLDQNLQIQLMVSNASAPGWMKDNDDLLNGGSIRSEFFQSYANYYLAFFSAYRSLGIEFETFSLQNQPHESSDFPTMVWDANTYTEFLRDYLEPTLRVNSFAPDYYVWDGNWTDNDTENPADIGTFALSVIQDAGVNFFALGTAWQCYSATNGFADYSQAFDLMLATIPDKRIYLTECGNSVDGRSFGDILTDDVGDMFIGSLRKSVRAIFYNSLALNDTNGPTQGGCSDCRSVIEIDNNDTVTFNAEYYALGHFSQFVKPGATRIDSPTFAGQLETVAYLNTDDTVVLITANRTSSAISFDLNWGGQFFNYSLPAKSVATFKWSANNSPIADEMQILQASNIASDTYDMIEETRDTTTGMYREHYNLIGAQTSQFSPAATGFGLIGLSIAFEMGWTPAASLSVITTLESLNDETMGFSPERNDNGFFKARLDSDGTNPSLTEYSVTETAHLLAGAIVARNVFAGNTDITDKVDALLSSVNWDGVVIDAGAGTLGISQTLVGGNTETQGVYGEQMLIAWLAKEAGNIAAADLWNNHYQSGEVFQRYVYNGIDVPADENGDPISATIQQLNFYLINDVISSANYRTAMNDQSAAEKQYWQDNFAEPSYVWGFGYGENTFSPTSPYFDSIVDHDGNMAHAPTIAGFIITDPVVLEDFLSWDDTNIGLVTNQATADQIPWRYSQQMPAWTATTVEVKGLIPQLMGLASHPGLLDISFYRNNTVYP